MSSANKASGPALPSLSAWATDRFRSLLESKTQADFDKAFDATFSNNVKITVNEKQITRDRYKNLLLEEGDAAPLRSTATVNISEQTSVEGGEGQRSGLVGLYYVVTSESAFRIYDTPTNRKSTSSLIAVVQSNNQDPIDSRRIVRVDQLVAEAKYSVEVPVSALPATGGVGSSGTKVAGRQI